MWKNKGVIDVPAMITKYFDEKELVKEGVEPFNEVLKKSDLNIHIEKPRDNYQKLAKNIIKVL